jgi:hypothetical protein
VLAGDGDRSAAGYAKCRREEFVIAFDDGRQHGLDRFVIVAAGCYGDLYGEGLAYLLARFESDLCLIRHQSEHSRSEQQAQGD